MAIGLTFPRILRNLFVVGLLSFLFSLMLGWFDTTTELLPYHEKLDTFCLYAPGLIALLAVVLVVWKTAGYPWLSRIVWAFSAFLIFYLGPFLLFTNTAALIEERIDFPAEKTKTFAAQLCISRAYMMTGKGRSWHVQTMPVWSDLKITEEDYDWMLHHRRPDDAGAREEEIRSRGHFCAAVSLQQAGRALRILHAGSQTLPSGTVRLCPTASE